MEPFWVRTSPRCPCRCAPPYFYLEYKVITASADHYSTYTAEDLVSRCSWDDLAWGQLAAMNQTTGEPDFDTIPLFEAEELNYTTASTAKARTGPPSDIEYIAYRRRVRVRVRMRSPAASLGMVYQLRTRQLAADSAGGYALSSETTSLATCGADGTDVTIFEDELGTPPPPNSAPGATWQSLIGGVGAGGIAVELRGRVFSPTRVKHGFHAYQEAAPAVPAIYALESASGGSPGCAEQDLPERTYDGQQTFIEDALVSTLSPDAVDSGMPSGDQATDPHDLPESGLLTQTATTRVVSRPFLCEGTPLEDAIHLQLSETISTTALRHAADTALTQQMTDELTTPSGGVLLGDNTARRLAQKILSPGETVYTLAAAVLRLAVGNFRAATTNDPYHLPVKWEKRTLNRVGGDATLGVQVVTADCHKFGGFDPRGQAYVGELSDSFTVQASLGQEILARRAYCDDANVITPLTLEPVETD